jgi:uncharacterized membrane protein
MDAAWQIVVWWLVFAATHMGLSSVSWRPRMVALLGQGGFLGLYSLISFATFIPLSIAYFSNRHQGPELWSIAVTVPGVHELAMLIAWASFAAAIGGATQPSVLSIGAATETRAHGMGRITRHPLFMFLGLWSAAHVVVNGFLTDVLFFGGFTVFCLLGCAHQDARKRSLEGDRLAAYFAETSLLPFGAIGAGRNRLVLEELPWGGLTAGAVLAVVVYLFHPALFG